MLARVAKSFPSRSLVRPQFRDAATAQTQQRYPTANAFLLSGNQRPRSLKPPSTSSLSCRGSPGFHSHDFFAVRHEPCSYFVILLGVHFSATRTLATTTARTQAPKKKDPKKQEWWKQYKTYTDGLPWELDAKATKFAKELLEATPKPLTEGWSKLDITTPFIESWLEARYIVTRTNTRQVYDTVLQEMGLHIPNDAPASHASSEPTNVASHAPLAAPSPASKPPLRYAIVLGNPGIGKSFGSLYALRHLLKANKFVVLHYLKASAMFAFVPKKKPSKKKPSKEKPSDYKVWRVDDAYPSLASRCAQLKNPDAFYIFDPNERLSPVVVAAHTIIPSSPDPEQVKDHLKNPYTARFYMNMATKEEILAAVKAKLFVPIDEETASSRFYYVGGNIRAIFFEGAFRTVVQQQQQKMTQLANDSILQQVFSNTPSITLSADAQSLCQNSTLSAYVAQAPFQDDNVTVGIVSEYVSTAILAQNLKAAYPRCVNDAKLWEKYCVAALSMGGDFDIHYLPYHDEKDERGKTLSVLPAAVLPGDKVSKPLVMKTAALYQEWKKRLAKANKQQQAAVETRDQALEQEHAAVTAAPPSSQTDDQAPTPREDYAKTTVDAVRDGDVPKQEQEHEAVTAAPPSPQTDDQAPTPKQGQEHAGETTSQTAPPLLVPADPNFTFVDAVGDGGVAFNFTMRKLPPKKLPRPNSIQEVLTNLGVTNENPLSWMLCVPHANYRLWTTASVKAQLGDTESRDECQAVMKDKVKQYVLRIPDPNTPKA